MLTIQSVFREYSVEFCDDFLVSLREVVREGDRVFVDATMAELHPELLGVAPGRTERVLPSEESKSYEALVPVFQKLIEGGFRKNHRLIAVGGGITQDVVSFIASLLYRGVDWIFYPTNMLTQCDSCIGSKTSINFRQYKNQLGGFYPPAAVHIDTKLTSTLGERERASGLGEMLHYFLVTSEADLDLFFQYAESVKSGGKGLDILMRRSLEIKKAMIEIDEFDKGPRNVFNYGHSFGHALESAVSYALPHGIAVAYGIDLANTVSVHLGKMKPELRNRIRQACQLVFDGFPIPEFKMDDYFAAIRKDKKNVGEKLGLILGDRIGNMKKELVELDHDLESVIMAFFQQKKYLSNA